MRPLITHGGPIPPVNHRRIAHRALRATVREVARQLGHHLGAWRGGYARCKDCGARVRLRAFASFECQGPIGGRS